MNSKAFIAFAKKNEGRELRTVTLGKKFMVGVVEDRLVFTPESGTPRTVYLSAIETFCAAFERTKSPHRSDYPETQSGSYLLGLAHAFQKEERA